MVYDSKCRKRSLKCLVLRGPRSPREMFFEFFPNLSLFPLLCEAVSCDCFQTSMPLKWNCGSTVFALDTQLVERFRLLPRSPLPCMKVFNQNLFLCHNISPWCPVRTAKPTGPSLEYGLDKFHAQFLACFFFFQAEAPSIVLVSFFLFTACVYDLKHQKYCMTNL